MRTEDSGRLRDFFIFLFLWYAVRYTVHFASYDVSASLLSTHISLHLQIAYLMRSLAGLIFSIWYLKGFCRRNNVGFSERFNIAQPMDIATPRFLAYLFIFLFVFTLPNVAYYVHAGRSPAFVVGHVELTSYILTGIRVVILSPMVEELIWRGFAYPIMKARFGVWMGIMVTALLFSAPHIPAFRHLPLTWALAALGYFFLIGAFLTIVLEREGNLKWCMLLHSFLNLCLLIVDVVFRELIYAAA